MTYTHIASTLRLTTSASHFGPRLQYVEYPSSSIISSSILVYTPHRPALPPIVNVAVLQTPSPMDPSSQNSPPTTAAANIPNCERTSPPSPPPQTQPTRTSHLPEVAQAHTAPQTSRQCIQLPPQATQSNPKPLTGYLNGSSRSLQFLIHAYCPGVDAASAHSRAGSG